MAFRCKHRGRHQRPRKQPVGYQYRQSCTSCIAPVDRNPAGYGHIVIKYRRYVRGATDQDERLPIAKRKAGECVR